MDKMRSLRKSVIALGIFAVLCFAVWAGVFVVLVMTQGGFLQFHLNQLVDVLVMPFKVGFNPKDLYFVNSIAVLALAALIVLFLIFTIVFSIVKRRGVMVFPFIAWVLCAVAGAEVAANLTQFSIADTSNELGYLALLKLGSHDIVGTLMSILAMVFGFLAAVLAFLTGIFDVPTLVSSFAVGIVSFFSTYCTTTFSLMIVGCSL